jgi:rod shape determining protein RodA
MKRLFIPVACILGAGLLVLSGISHRFLFSQMAWAFVGVLVVLFLWKVDWRVFLQNRTLLWGFYSFTILLLIVARFFSPMIRNTHSWIVLGPFTFQPVELAKIALILVFAQYFSRKHLAVARWKNIFISFLIFALPAGLTLLQPDMGSASILFAIWFGFLLVSGLPRERVMAALLIFAALGVFGWNYVLKDYQRARIAGVFNPEANALTVNYQQIQAKVAIGSGGFWGKGYGQGTQVQLGYLAEPGSDFILASLIEEWGLLGYGVVITAFMYLIYAILGIGALARQNFEKFFCLGTAMMFGFQFLVNAGSTVGLFPVVGVTFPFLSHGGSSLLTDFALLAIINSIAYRS